MKGFIGFEVKENISVLETYIGKIHPFISLYEFDESFLRISKMVEDLKQFKPIHPSDHSTYNRRKKRFSHHMNRKNDFWYNQGTFTTSKYTQHKTTNIIIPQTTTYLEDIFRPILIHLKLNKKESYPFWILNKYQKTKQYNKIKKIITQQNNNSITIPQISITLDELGIYVNDKKLSSKKLI